jgi:hypothetical protein
VFLPTTSHFVFWVKPVLKMFISYFTVKHFSSEVKSIVSTLLNRGDFPVPVLLLKEDELYSEEPILLCEGHRHLYFPNLSYNCSLWNCFIYLNTICKSKLCYKERNICVGVRTHGKPTVSFKPNLRLIGRQKFVHHFWLGEDLIIW